MFAGFQVWCTKRAHRRTFYSSNGANPANRRLNRAGRTAAPYEGKRPKSDANAMVAYSFFFLFKKKEENEMIYGLRREKLGFVDPVCSYLVSTTFIEWR
jgi:hypothetical protein